MALDSEGEGEEGPAARKSDNCCEVTNEPVKQKIEH